MYQPRMPMGKLDFRRHTSLFLFRSQSVPLHCLCSCRYEGQELQTGLLCTGTSQVIVPHFMPMTLVHRVGTLCLKKVFLLLVKAKLVFPNPTFVPAFFSPEIPLIMHYSFHKVLPTLELTA